jgi:glutathione synthase/RimK-type ligase-like ATP-grasp enzyme
MKAIHVEVREDATLEPFTLAIEGDIPDTAVGQLQFAGVICPVKRVIFRSKSRKKGTTHGSTLSMNREMISRLHFPAPHSIHLLPTGRTWILGPVLGLYVDIQPSSSRPFGEQTKLFEDLSIAGQRLGVCVTVLGPTVYPGMQAWRFFSKKMSQTEKSGDKRTTVGQWERVFMESPDIVLRRSGSFTKQHESAALQDLKQFSNANILHTLPRTCSNKWKLYGFLRKIPEIRSFLPYTTMATQASQVYHAVRSRADVYIKPLMGAQGVSIYHLKWDGASICVSWEERILPRKTERMSTLFQPETRIREQRISSLPDFSSFWETTRLKRCLVQDKVALRCVGSQPTDFRWLLQSSDQPVVIARVARLGKPGAVTTNIHTGGQAVAAEEVFSKLTAFSEGNSIISELDDLAATVAKALAREHGHFAELGIDFALDEAGRIFLFEINPTPGRRMLRSLEPSVRELSIHEMLEYAIRATGFTG